MTEHPRITRRSALVATGAAGLGAAGFGAAQLGNGDGSHDPNATASHPAGQGARPRSNARMPVVFIPHGGGPWPFVDLGMNPDEVTLLANHLRALRDLPPLAPKALLVISAHWEAPVPTVMSGEHPPLLFDYYNFPREAYQLQWPAPGHPELAARVCQLLGAAGFESASDDRRGFDHGTFVPLKLAYPDADVPVVQLSLKAGLDPREHLAIGRALAALRDEGVFIIGSGMSFHNMRAFRDPSAASKSSTFDAWLQHAVTLDPVERDHDLERWAQAPTARYAHPREEHLLPLMVVAGAAGSDRGRLHFSGSMMAAQLSGYRFGA